MSHPGATDPPESSESAKAGKAGAGRKAVDALLAHSSWVSQDQVQCKQGLLSYRSVVEFLPVFKRNMNATGEEPVAAVMCTAHLAERQAQAAPRPVCFAFNGGPGSASVWLQLGALGPKRVVVEDSGHAPVPPYAVQDNPLTWLDAFDLVFIDPPHTGWSLAVNDDARKTLLSVDGDVDALTGVITGWLDRHQRWGSAVYLAGESYGTTRAAALTDSLLGAGLALRGVILVSCAMDLQTLRHAPANELPYAVFLPAFANTSQYHGLLKGSIGRSPQDARAAAESFVNDDYLDALHAGHRLSHDRRRRVARRLSDLTGLNIDLVEQLNLRISDQNYFFEALRSRGQIVGRLESRVTGPMSGGHGRAWEFDPGIDAITAPYGMAGQAYFRSQLGVDLKLPYHTLNREVNKSWDWNRGEAKGNAYASTTPDLARALRRNGHMEVLVASGRYDLGTPYSASDWSLAHLDVPTDLMSRVTHRYYDAGHMMYTRQSELEQLHQDLMTWLSTH